MSRVCVTGAGGYIGGRLVDTLQEAGLEVQGIVREPAPHLRVPAIVRDLSRVGGEELQSMFDGVQTVVHLAGENEVVSARQPAVALAQTIVATERVAEACAAAGVRRLVYTSTVHAYGARMAPGATLSEDLRPEPRSAYGISRLACEHVVAGCAGGTYEPVVLRLTNSVGAPSDPAVDRWTLVTNDLCRQGALTGRLRLLSSGAQWRDFVPLGDVCAALAGAVAAEASALPAGVYNIGSGTPTTVRALAELIQDSFQHQTGQRPELLAPAPEPGAAAAAYHVSVERAAACGLLLGSRLEDAVAETVRFCLRHREELA